MSWLQASLNAFSFFKPGGYMLLDRKNAVDISDCFHFKLGIALRDEDVDGMCASLKAKLLAKYGELLL